MAPHRALPRKVRQALIPRIRQYTPCRTPRNITRNSSNSSHMARQVRLCLTLMVVLGMRLPLPLMDRSRMEAALAIQMRLRTSSRYISSSISRCRVFQGRFSSSMQVLHRRNSSNSSMVHRDSSSNNLILRMVRLLLRRGLQSLSSNTHILLRATLRCRIKMWGRRMGGILSFSNSHTQFSSSSLFSTVRLSISINWRNSSSHLFNSTSSNRLWCRSNHSHISPQTCRILSRYSSSNSSNPLLLQVLPQHPLPVLLPRSNRALRICLMHCDNMRIRMYRHGRRTMRVEGQIQVGGCTLCLGRCPLRRLEGLSRLLLPPKQMARRDICSSSSSSSRSTLR